MGKDPAFLFYPGDYLGGTMGFTLEMHGAYLLALLLQFNIGPFSEDKIKNIVGDTWHSISSKFKEKKGLYYNDRLNDEIERRLAYSESRRKNVSKRYNKGNKPLSDKKISDLHMKVHKNLHMETRTRARNRTRNTKIFIEPSFEEFEKYCSDNNHKNIARRAYDGYKEANWHDSKGNKIKNWKQKLQHVWFREENKDQQEEQQYDEIT